MPMSRRALPITLLLAACGDDGGSADAAPPDPCAPQMTLTGELLDWDSGGSVGFLGVPTANVTLRSDPSFTDFTAPNGRFELCVPASNDLADVTPTAASAYVPGVLVVDRRVQAALPTLSLRSFKPTRAADFGFDAAAAHVFVHVIGDARTVTTAATPTTTQTFADGTWSAGNTGTDIYLGNIPAAAETTLTVTGGSFTGPTTLPLTAGSFTYVTLLAN